MSGLIRAEYRKIFSTKLWWALLLPVAVVALLFTLAGGGFAGLLAAAPGGGAEQPFALVTLGLTMGFTATFAAIFGALALSSEDRHRTITTTLLTGSSRLAVLAAKLVAHGSIGMLYAVTTVLFGFVGAAIGGGPLPSAGAFAAVAATGSLAVLLWTVLGVGVGYLIGNQVAAVLVLVLYSLIVEPLVGGVLTAAEIPTVAEYLPGGASTALTTDLAFAELGAGGEGQLAAELGTELAALATLPWWAGALLLGGYALLLLGLGALAGELRDIT